jgi:hypothetical protein
MVPQGRGGFWSGGSVGESEVATDAELPLPGGGNSSTAVSRPLSALDRPQHPSSVIVARPQPDHVSRRCLEEDADNIGRARDRTD